MVSRQAVDPSMAAASAIGVIACHLSQVELISNAQRGVLYAPS
jgi:hypothetical protein